MIKENSTIYKEEWKKYTENIRKKNQAKTLEIKSL
jgi:hypothetical protein